MSDQKEKKSILEKFSILKRLKSIKHIELILIGIFVTILIFIYTSTKSDKTAQVKSEVEFSAEAYSEFLEYKLSNLLTGISGAGNVSVMITLDGGMKYDYETKKEEVVTENGIGENINKKTTLKEDVVIVTINGKSTPLIIKESYPEIIGVVIVSSGATNVQVKLDILRATQVLLNVDESAIEIIVGNV